MIRVTDLHKRYGDTHAVRGISFEVEDGELFGLLGPNGAGKSTTIHMLVGALAPDTGTITIDGVDDPMRPAARRRLGIAPQENALYGELTGEENLAFFGRLYGLAGAALAERVAWALRFAGLVDRKGDRVSAYSGGMKRRLNLACALVHDPKVVLLDEPTVGVDPQSRNHLFECIERLRAEGRTILYTTHHMEEAQRLCDRVAIVDHGEVLALDTVDALIAKHGGEQVAVAELERPPGPEVELPGTLEGTTLRVETDTPLEVLGALHASGVGLARVRIDRPDLKSVFLHLTGKRLRD